MIPLNDLGSGDFFFFFSPYIDAPCFNSHKGINKCMGFKRYVISCWFFFGGVLDSYATLDQRGRRNTLDETLEPAENDIQVKNLLE